ncbi:MAG: hypothetical protein ABFC42_14155 [Sulfuricella sp.]
MNTALKRRLERLEMVACRNNGAGSTATLVEPVPDASADQWRQFEVSKAAAEAAGRTMVVIRATQPAKPIIYHGRLVIVPPKSPALIEVRPLQMEGNNYAH